MFNFDRAARGYPFILLAVILCGCANMRQAGMGRVQAVEGQVAVRHDSYTGDKEQIRDATAKFELTPAMMALREAGLLRQNAAVPEKKGAERAMAKAGRPEAPRAQTAARTTDAKPPAPTDQETSHSRAVPGSVTGIHAEPVGHVAMVADLPAPASEKSPAVVAGSQTKPTPNSDSGRKPVSSAIATGKSPLMDGGV